MAIMSKSADAKTPATSPAQPAKPEGGESSDMVYLGSKKVRNRFNWRPSSEGPKYTKESVFDFSGCTEEQVLFLAMYGATVKIQAQLRTAANSSPNLKVDPKLFDEVNVLNDIILSTAKADPTAVAIHALRKAGASEAVIQAAAADLAKAKK